MQCELCGREGPPLSVLEVVLNIVVIRRFSVCPICVRESSEIDIIADGRIIGGGPTWAERRAAEASAGSVPPPAADKDDAEQDSTTTEPTPALAALAHGARKALEKRAEGDSATAAVRGANIHPVQAREAFCELFSTAQRLEAPRDPTVAQAAHGFSEGDAVFAKSQAERDQPTAAEILRRALAESDVKVSAYSVRAVLRRLLSELTVRGEKSPSSTREESE